MIATANAFKMFGIEPIFVDVNPDTLCLDYSALNAALTSKTKAFVVMSANGRYPSEGIKIFEEFAKKNDLVLIEDAANLWGHTTLMVGILALQVKLVVFLLIIKNNYPRVRVVVL